MANSFSGNRDGCFLFGLGRRRGRISEITFRYADSHTLAFRDVRPYNAPAQYLCRENPYLNGVSHYSTLRLRFELRISRCLVIKQNGRILADTPNPHKAFQDQIRELVGVGLLPVPRV